MKKTTVPHNQYFIKQLPLILVFIFQLIIPFPKANSQITNEYTLKTAFLLRVANFVEWPANSKVNDKSKDFILCIYGDNPFDNQLKMAIASKKIKIKGKKITIQVTNELDEIKNADILFISSSEKYNLSKILKKIESLAILTIGDTKGYAERGVMINTFILDSYLSFDINMEASKKVNFYISSKLLSKAERVLQQ